MKKLLFVPMLLACYLGMGQAPGSLKIGDSYGGGVVFYLVRFWEPGYDPNAPHGLIAATVDQGVEIMWGDFQTIIGAAGTAMGTGMSNTNKIVAAQGAPISYVNVDGVTISSYAAGLAKAYRGGGYSDWYLPSKDELNKLFINRTVIGVGGYPDPFEASNKHYWSSSESVEPGYSQVKAWEQNFMTGLQILTGAGGRDILRAHTYVRAIRSF
jgi:hypothetical protein